MTERYIPAQTVTSCGSCPYLGSDEIDEWCKRVHGPTVVWPAGSKDTMIADGCPLEEAPEGRTYFLS